MSWLSIGWSAVTGVVSIVVAVSVGSLALLGSGASVLLDLASSGVLVHRFTHPDSDGVAERRAHRVAAGALLGLGVLLGAFSAVRWVRGGSANPNPAALALAVASVVILPGLAARKYAVARRVASRALAADAHITVVGAATALLTVVGLALTHWGHPLGDTLAALAIAVVAAVVGLSELRASGG